MDNFKYLELGDYDLEQYIEDFAEENEGIEDFAEINEGVEQWPT